MNERRTAVITGANKGIGHATALRLGALGWTIWAGARDPLRAQESVEALQGASVDAQALIIDVTDPESVTEAAYRFNEQESQLDVLVNNAGLNLRPVTGPTSESIEDIRRTFEVNTFGPLRVVQAFLPALRRAPLAHIVMVSSGLGSIGETLDLTSENWTVQQAGYCASKAALNMLTVKLAKELLADSITVNAADPGLTATDLTGYAGDREPHEAAEIVVRLAMQSPYGPTAGFFVDHGAARWPGTPGDRDTHATSAPDIRLASQLPAPRDGQIEFRCPRPGAGIGRTSPVACG